MAVNNEQQFLKQVGKQIAGIRQDKHMTQEQLAGECGLDRVAIAYIETGKRKPMLSSLYKIASGLGVSVSDLVDV